MSWVVTCLVTGTVIEIFNQENYDRALKLNSVKVEPIADYLGRINKEIRDADSEESGHA